MVFPLVGWFNYLVWLLGLITTYFKVLLLLL